MLINHYLIQKSIDFPFQFLYQFIRKEKILHSILFWTSRHHTTLKKMQSEFYLSGWHIRARTRCLRMISQLVALCNSSKIRSKEYRKLILCLLWMVLFVLDENVIFGLSFTLIFDAPLARYYLTMVYASCMFSFRHFLTLYHFRSFSCYYYWYFFMFSVIIVIAIVSIIALGITIIIAILFYCICFWYFYCLNTLSYFKMHIFLALILMQSFKVLGSRHISWAFFLWGICKNKLWKLVLLD